MILNASIIFKAIPISVTIFRPRCAARLAADCPKPSFKPTWVAKTQIGYRPMGQYASGLHTDRMFTGIKHILIGKIENIPDSAGYLFKSVAGSSVE